jgi:hypothetical protein
MDHADPRQPAAPVDGFAAVREWLWRHSSQPNGDPWDGDPEHLEWAARNLLNDLIQSLLTSIPPTNATGRTYGWPPTSFVRHGKEGLLWSEGTPR